MMLAYERRGLVKSLEHDELNLMRATGNRYTNCAREVDRRWNPLAGCIQRREIITDVCVEHLLFPFMFVEG